MVDNPDSLWKSNDDNQASLKRLISWHNFWRSLVYLMLVSLGGGLSYSWYFLTQESLPTIEKAVSNYLSRPIRLGEVEAISLTSIRLGESHLPTTDTENDYAIAKGVEISIDLWQLLKQRVELTIDIDQAEALLQQDVSNAWLKLKLKRGERREGWRVTVKQISLQDSDLTVRSNQSQTDNDNLIAEVSIPAGNIVFDSQQFTFNITGDIADGGKVIGNGFYQPDIKKWFLKINHQDIDIDTVTSIVKLPVSLDSGKATGEIGLSFIDSKFDLASLQGDIDFEGVNLNIPVLPQSLSKSKGNIKFQDRDIILESVNTNFGLINANAEGIIDDFKTLNIEADTTESVTIDRVWQTLKLPENKIT